MRKRYSYLSVCGLVCFLFFVGCISANVTQDLSNKAKDAIRWELVTVQPDFVDKTNFLAISEMNGQVLDKPLIFGIDIILLSPGEHQAKIVLGKREDYTKFIHSGSGTFNWIAEVGTIILKEPFRTQAAQEGQKIQTHSPQKPRKRKGRNYLVASYDKIYTSNTQFPEYIQRWLVRYPREITADKSWSIEPLTPFAQVTQAPAEAQTESETNSQEEFQQTHSTNADEDA